MAVLKAGVCASSPGHLRVWVYVGEYGCTCLWSHPHTCGWDFRTIHSNPVILLARILRPGTAVWSSSGNSMRESRWEPGQPHWRPWVPSRLDTMAWGLAGWAPWWEGSGFSLGFSIPGRGWTLLPLDFFTWRPGIIIPISCLSWISKIRWTVPHT